MPSKAGQFDFGANWRRYLGSLTPQRIAVAEASLQDAFGLDSFDGRSFLDVGCGSGLFSFAACRLGARVHSFDANPTSVECAHALRGRLDESAAKRWTIEQGDALSRAYMEGLEPADMVYSWGVLHHTGDLDKALENVVIPLRPSGSLYIALYRRKSWKTPAWTAVKKAYCSNRLGRALVLGTFIPGFVVYGALADALTRPRVNPIRRYSEYYQERGMSPVWDWVDWLGGYPYEASEPQEIVEALSRQGLSLFGCRLVSSSMGNHEYLFVRDPARHEAERSRPWLYWKPSKSEPLPVQP